MNDRAQLPLYRCGTLTYTRLGLITLFIYLLWGDFCYAMVNLMVPTLLPMVLKDHNASDFTIGILMGSIPALMNFIINPIISTKSDRTRSRWGRRIPYMLFTVPFTALFMILIGWSDQIGHRICRIAGTGHTNTVIVALIAFCVIGYRGFNLFVGSVFYYIFADVVPPQFIGRFMSFFKVVGTMAGMLFNLCVMPYAKTHLAIIFTAVAVIHALSFTVICLRVKEGEYPPPPPPPKSRIEVFTGYFRDCFSIPFFAVLFVGMGFNFVSTTCRDTFNLLFVLHELDLTTAQFGRAMGIALFVSVVLFIPLGYLVDKLHPLRVFLVGAFLVILVNPFGFFFVRGYRSFLAMAVMLAVVYAIQNASLVPMYMKLYPKEKFGQFCSAGAMVKAIMLVVANGVSGWFIGRMGYRWLYVWDFFFTIMCFSLIMWVYIRWKKLGGDRGYRPPERVSAGNSQR